MFLIYLIYTMYNFSNWYDTERGWRMVSDNNPRGFNLSSWLSSIDHVSLSFLNSLAWVKGNGTAKYSRKTCATDQRNEQFILHIPYFLSPGILVLLSSLKSKDLKSKDLKDINLNTEYSWWIFKRKKKNPSFHIFSFYCTAQAIVNYF